MKIRRLQITLEPRCPVTVVGASGFKTLTVEVRADGQHYSHTEILDEDDFQDVFGQVMKNAERRIRDLVAKQIT